MTLTSCWHRVPGGTAAAALHMAAALDERDDVEVVGVAPRHRRVPEDPWRPAVRTVSLPLPRHLLYDSWHYLGWPPVELAAGAVDIVHATAMILPPRRSAALVLTVHDLFPLEFPDQFTRRGARVMRRGAALARRRADLVLCSSRATMRDCVEAGFAEERLRLVPLGVESAVAGDDEVARVKASYGLGRPYVLWAGTVEPRKNLPTLLESFRKLGRADLDLVLVGQFGWREDLDRHIGDQSDRVRRVGFVPSRDLAALYRGAEVFCLPSLREGFGLPLLEAMAQGTPVVTSRGTATEEVVGDAGMVVEPLDASEIADALAALLDDGASRQRLGSAGAARAQQFTWAATASLIADAYREVS
ncbi:MAG: glycosyltransferase family 1 protein [Acidobacteria bacterium]|nr:MAG: glycosyltransferase family 1 protein [Acidobacteriota bacterium]